MRRRPKPASAGATVSIEGREFPVLDRLRVGRRSYLLLERLSAAPRERYRAFDPHACPGGDQRAILVLPRSGATSQHLRVLQRLNDENLPTILEYRPQGDHIFVVMTWVRGMDLAAYLRDVRRGALPPPSTYEAVRLVRGVAHGLGRLHSARQIVHGDLKPANLVLTRNPSRLVLIDFGSAWTTERTVGRDPGDGTHAGYAAPELQTPGAFVDFRSDQFSASVILYELLTLRLPYDGLGGQAGRPEFRGRMRDKLVPPSGASADRRRLPRDVWPALDRLVLTGLALDPEDRYPTRRAWLDACDEVQRGMRDPSRLTPMNALLTRVVDGVAGLFTRRR